MKEYLRSDGNPLTIEYQVPVGTDSVIFNVYDIDLEDYIQSDEAVYFAGTLFYINLNTDVTAYDRKIKIEIQIINENTYDEDELYCSIVRPYATTTEIAEYADLAIVGSNPSFGETTERALLREEKRARTFINSIIGTNFDYQYKSVATSGQGTDILHLGQKIEFFDKIIKDDEVLYDSYEEVNDLDYPIVISNSKNNLKIVAEGENISEWTDVAVINNPGYFEKGSTYIVRGGYGWKYVPIEINQAVCELAKDMLCNDYNYRMKNVKSISNDSYNIAFDTNTATGNIIVDELIYKYRRFDLWAI